MSQLSSLPPELLSRRVLDSSQTAEYLGFSLPHFRRLYRAQKAPAPILIGDRKYGWRVCDIAAWLDSRAALPSKTV